MPATEYEVSHGTSGNAEAQRTTLTDVKGKELKTRFIGWRNFDGILKLTWENKANTTMLQNMAIICLMNQSDQLDKSRAPSWSKILAVRRRRKVGILARRRCKIRTRIADFLPADATKDLLLSPDDGGGYNGEVWLLRNTDNWALRYGSGGI